MSLIQRIIVNVLTFISLTVLFPSMVHVESLWYAILAAFVLAFLNMFIAPILNLLTLPLTLLTFGLFSFIINAGMLELTSFFVSGIQFSSFWSALLTAFVLSLVNGVVIKNNMV